MENIADFVSAYLIGNLLQMAFRFWAFRRWVFPDVIRPQRRQGAGVTLTAGGIAEVFEDVEESRQRHAAAALACARQPGESARRLLGPEGVENLVIQQRVDLLHARNVVELQRIL